MINPTMCNDTELSRLNRQRVEANKGGLWHLTQEVTTKNWKHGDDKPESLKTYNLPMANKDKRTFRPSRLKAPTLKA